MSATTDITVYKDSIWVEFDKGTENETYKIFENGAVLNTVTFDNIVNCMMQFGVNDPTVHIDSMASAENMKTACEAVKYVKWMTEDVVY